MFVYDVQQVVGLRERFGDVVAGFAVGDVHPGDAPRLVAELTQIERFAHSMKLELLTVIDDSDTWRGAGDRSKEAWLARTTGTTVGEATGLFETGAALAELPVVADAVKAGTLSPVQAREIAGAASLAKDAQSRLVDQAGRGSVKELREACKRTRAAADPDPEATHARIHADRAATKHDNADGSATITLTGTVDAIGTMWARAERRAESIFKQAHKEGRREPEAAYRFDAVAELLAQQGEGPAMPVGADAKVIYVLDWEAHVRGRVEGDERCELLGHGPVPVSVVNQAAQEAFIAAVVASGDDVRLVAHLGRKPTVLQETALQAMTPACVVQGCGQTTRLEIHHVADWTKTQLTVLDYLDHGCAHHHDLITNHGYTLGDRDDHRQRPLLPPPPGWTRPPPDAAYGIDPAMVRQIKDHLDDLKRQREDERRRRAS